MQTTSFTAPGIECAGCANSIKNAIGKLSGVESVSVDVAAKNIQVSHKPEMDRQALVNALDKAGFPISER